MELFWFWILILFLIIVVAGAPGWGYTRSRWPYRYGGSYRYYPSAGAGIVAVLILLLFWMGLIAIAWPLGRCAGCCELITRRGRKTRVPTSHSIWRQQCEFKVSAKCT